MIGRWLRALRERRANQLARELAQFQAAQLQVAAGSEPANVGADLIEGMLNALKHTHEHELWEIGAAPNLYHQGAPIRVLWGEPSKEPVISGEPSGELLAAYERGRSAERAWCVARIKHWFGGDDPFDAGYECVREINALGEDNR